MESLREINRTMEREIAKGSTPIRYSGMELGEYSYRMIETKEKLHEVLAYLLRLKEFRDYLIRTAINNVYMDVAFKNVQFKRTHSPIERTNIFVSIRRYAKKLRPDFNGKVCVETARCQFTVPEESLKECRITYNDGEAYALALSNKYIMGLYAHCLEARRRLAGEYEKLENFSEREQKIIRLENVRDVLFQCLLLDDVQLQGQELYANLYTIYLLND